MIDKIFNQCIR